MKKRILSLVMALAMALSLLPMAAFAAEGTTTTATPKMVSVTLTKVWDYPEDLEKTATFTLTYTTENDTTPQDVVFDDGQVGTYELKEDAEVTESTIVFEVPEGAVLSIEESGYAEGVTVTYAIGDDTDLVYDGAVTYTITDDTDVTFTNTYNTEDDTHNHGRDPGGHGPALNPDGPELNTEEHFAYIIGYPDGTIRPDNSITRAEVATIFFRLMEESSRNANWSQTNSFSDVSLNQWFNNAISTIEKAKIVNGYPDGSFRPNDKITRAEFATIVARFLAEGEGGDSEFPDVAGHWAEKYISKAAANGIINGYTDGSFRPNQPITRAEAMAMTNRLLGRTSVDANSFIDGMRTWTDSTSGKWYYADIQEATNSHAYTMENGKEVWTAIKASPDWYSLEKAWSTANS